MARADAHTAAKWAILDSNQGPLPSWKRAGRCALLPGVAVRLRTGHVGAAEGGRLRTLMQSVASTLLPWRASILAPITSRRWPEKCALEVARARLPLRWRRRSRASSVSSQAGAGVCRMARKAGGGSGSSRVIGGSSDLSLAQAMPESPECAWLVPCAATASCSTDLSAKGRPCYVRYGPRMRRNGRLRGPIGGLDGRTDDAEGRSPGAAR
jgi:hypothetical protein